MNLRDHDHECEHGNELSHPVTGEGTQIGNIVCPGGAAVNIDYPAALDEYNRQATYGGNDWPSVFDAALGLTDD